MPGGYPMHFRHGVGRPLLIVHPHGAERSSHYFPSLEPHAGRPVAVLGSKAMANFSASAEVVVQGVLEATGWTGADMIQVVGYSVGGFAALLYGAVLSLALPRSHVAVIAYSPMVCVWPIVVGPRARHHTLVASAILADAQRAANLQRFGDSRPWIAAAAAANGNRFSIHLLYAARNERDAAQAGLLRDAPGVTLAPMPTGLHTFYRQVEPKPEQEWLAAKAVEPPRAEMARNPEKALREAKELGTCQRQ